MRAEDLKGWLVAERRGEKKGETADKEGGGREDTRAGAENWARVVELMQTAFRDRDLAEEATWQAVVLIPKGKKDYRGIGLEGGGPRAATCPESMEGVVVGDGGCETAI